MKRILPILIIILFSAIHSQGQSSRGPATDAEKILRLYPNPATSNYITFDLQRNYEKGLTIQVFNFLGKKMYESLNINEKTTVDLSDFNRGVYIYHLSDKNGKLLESGKFQVSR